MNNIIPLQESPKGLHGGPSGPMDYIKNTVCKLKLSSCYAHKTTASHIDVKQLLYVLKTSSMQTIRISVGYLV